jgi:hypothetical protein
MTPKERISAVTAHVEPDKVPAHINATKWVVEKLKTTLKVGSEKNYLKPCTLMYMICVASTFIQEQHRNIQGLKINFS